MIKAHDLYYLPRVENLRREYGKCEKKYRELQEEFDHSLDFETGSCYTLNILADKMQTVSDLMVALEDQIERLRLEISN